MYREALRLRKELPAFRGDFAWHESDGGDVLAFSRDDEVACVVNFGAEPVSLPDGEVLLTSTPLVDGLLPSDATAWIATW